MQREQLILELVALTFGVALLIVVLILLLRRKLARIHQSIETGVPTGGSDAFRAHIDEQQEATRRHISAVFDSVANDTQTTKTRMDNLMTAFKKVARVFGIHIE